MRCVLFKDHVMYPSQIAKKGWLIDIFEKKPEDIVGYDYRWFSGYDEFKAHVGAMTLYEREEAIIAAAPLSLNQRELAGYGTVYDSCSLIYNAFMCLCNDDPVISEKEIAQMYSPTEGFITNGFPVTDAADSYRQLSLLEKDLKETFDILYSGYIYNDLMGRIVSLTEEDAANKVLKSVNAVSGLLLSSIVLCRAGVFKTPLDKENIASRNTLFGKVLPIDISKVKGSPLKTVYLWTLQIRSLAWVPNQVRIECSELGAPCPSEIDQMFRHMSRFRIEDQKIDSFFKHKFVDEAGVVYDLVSLTFYMQEDRQSTPTWTHKFVVWTCIPFFGKWIDVPAIDIFRTSNYQLRLLAKEPFGDVRYPVSGYSMFCGDDHMLIDMRAVTFMSFVPSCRDPERNMLDYPAHRNRCRSSSVYPTIDQWHEMTVFDIFSAPKYASWWCVLESRLTNIDKQHISQAAKTTSVAEIARYTGLSRSTISRVLHPLP